MPLTYDPDVARANRWRQTVYQAPPPPPAYRAPSAGYRAPVQRGPARSGQAPAPAAPPQQQPVGYRYAETSRLGYQNPKQNWLQQMTSRIQQSNARPPIKIGSTTIPALPQIDLSGMNPFRGGWVQEVGDWAQNALTGIAAYPGQQALATENAYRAAHGLPLKPAVTPGTVLPPTTYSSYDPDIVRANMWRLANSPGISGTLPSLPPEQPTTTPTTGGGYGYGGYGGYPYYGYSGGGGGGSYARGVQNWAYGMLTWKR